MRASREHKWRFLSAAIAASVQAGTGVRNTARAANRSVAYN
jgi:hypothetical protein